MFLVIHIGRKTGRYVVSQQTNVIRNCSNLSYKVGFYFENLALRDLACSLHLDRRGGNLLSQTDGRLRSASAKFDMENQTSPCAAETLHLCAAPETPCTLFFFNPFLFKNLHTPPCFLRCSMSCREVRFEKGSTTRKGMLVNVSWSIKWQILFKNIVHLDLHSF